MREGEKLLPKCFSYSFSVPIDPRKQDVYLRRDKHAGSLIKELFTSLSSPYSDYNYITLWKKSVIFRALFIKMCVFL